MLNVKRFTSICAAYLLLVSTASAKEIDFNREVRPILADKCYACHGPDPETREADLRFDTKAGAFVEIGGDFAIVPNKPNDSLLIQRINSSDPDEVMPPADHPKKLTDAEKQTLLDWIKQGAAWDDQWAYVAPKKHPIPKTADPAWSRSFIDAFVLARLEKEGLKPAPRADARTLLRRLSFDLTGLPPTWDEVVAFTKDDSTEAYEQAIDRLLKSPHFGERMAQHWLDLVRYADTVGYHGDQNVSVSPFRDYVIEAFNNNMPFDRFTREQLAGDLLQNPTLDQKVASGYNRLGMMSAEGGVQPKEYLAKYAAERVRNISGVWMGSTMGCAECHEHKYDPFTQKDFYSMASFFADIQERGLYSGSNFGPYIDVPSDDLPALLAPHEKQLAQLQKTLDTPTPELAAEQAKWEQQVQSLPHWQVLKPASAKALHNTQLKVQGDGSVLAAGSSPNQNTYTLTAKTKLKEITGFRIEVLPDKSLPKQGPGRAGNGNFVITEFRVQQQANGEKAATSVSLQNASATIEQTLAGDKTPYGKWSAASAIDNDAKGSSWGWAILPGVGKPQALVVETSQAIGDGNEVTLTFVIEQNHTNGKHTLGKFRLSATSSPRPLKAGSEQALPDSLRKILAIDPKSRSAEQSKQLSAHYRSIAPSLAETRNQLAKVKQQIESLKKQHTRVSLVTITVKPRDMRVLPRGNWMDDSGELVQPAVPHFLKQIRTEGRATRLDLANWLVASDNPLTARVFVNRIWKMLHGTGLSKVLDDVGAQGEPPSHPELLDVLALDFIENGWNVKRLIKQIVMTNTYQQSSMMRPELKDRDPYNRLLARQSRFRLDAEFIRDNALSVSGLLVTKLGGRSVKPYQPVGLYRHLNFPRRTYQQDGGENQYRRGVYTHWQRQFLHPAMKAFDAPSRDECAAERPRSNTPLGALVLLNDPSYVEAARVFATRVIKEGGSSPDERLKWAMDQALSRDPSSQEAETLRSLLQAHLDHYKTNEGDAAKLIAIGLHEAPKDVNAVELAAWTSVTRTIFNMHEFINRN